MTSSRLEKILIVLLSATLLTGGTGAAQPLGPRSKADYFIKTHGLVESDRNPLVKRAQSVFERVYQVADKKAKYTPRLIVVDSSEDPWAIALTDGHIVLSRKAVEICFRGVDESEGDARMAFVLGHELAHLAKDDFWHADVYLALANSPKTQVLRNLLQNTADVPGTREDTRLAVMRQKELQADDWGFLYAALAGYPVHRLVDPAGGKQADFFQDWMRQTQTTVDRTHPDPADRARLLKIRLEGLLEAAAYFDFGVRLAYFGRFNDAIHFFEAVQKSFPSREVHGNLGYSYLRLAEQAMAPERVYRFWLPRVLDVKSRADAARGAARSGPQQALSGEARQSLEQARNYLERALVSDPYYIAARENLFSVFFHLGRYAQARALLGQLESLKPGDPEIQALTAVTLYQEGVQLEIDLTSKALELLRKAQRAPNPPVPVYYNLARILQENNQADQAFILWKRLSEGASALPMPYYSRVCAALGALGCPALTRGQPVCGGAVDVRLPVNPGIDLWQGPDGGKSLFDGWRSTAFDLPDDRNGHIYALPDRSAEVLELNYFVEMTVVRGERFNSAGPINEDQNCQVSDFAISGGSIIPLTPQRAVLLRGGGNAELWVIRQPDHNDPSGSASNPAP